MNLQLRLLHEDAIFVDKLRVDSFHSRQLNGEERKEILGSLALKCLETRCLAFFDEEPADNCTRCFELFLGRCNRIHSHCFFQRCSRPLQSCSVACRDLDACGTHHLVLKTRGLVGCQSPDNGNDVENLRRILLVASSTLSVRCSLGGGPGTLIEMGYDTEKGCFKPKVRLTLGVFG